MKISIVTVSFNSDKTIASTIESVISQKEVDYEYIIVDGMSTDSTVDIIKKYARDNDRVKWLSEKDYGIYDAMNKGIKMASGDIVGILNSDDFYTHDAVLSKIEQSFSCNVDCVFADVRFVRDVDLDKTVRYYSSKNFSTKKFRYGFMPAHPTFFTFKKYYDLYGYYSTDYIIAADYELLIRFLYTHKLNYYYLPEAIIKMRLGGASTKSLKSNYILNKEIVRGCAENGIKTNMFVLFLKYLLKVKELLVTNNE